MGQQILVTIPNIKFHETLLRDCWVATCGQMGRHGEANGGIFSTFHCEHARDAGIHLCQKLGYSLVSNLI
jgi:hypothetical protein